MKNFTCLVLLLVLSSPSFSQEMHNIYNLPVEKMEEGLSIQNLSGLNSASLDYCPVPVKGGLIFTTDRKRKKSWWKKLFTKDYSNLMFAAQTAPGHFTAPVALAGDVNGEFNEGAATISADGRTMIFTRNSNKKNKKGVYDLNLYSAEFLNGEWQNILELDLGTSDYTNCHPALSADGQTLYFASNRENGYGGMDIYQTNKVDDCWQAPVNMGESVNSASHELFPQLGKRGELYFSSNAPGGMGMLDIWVSRVGISGTRLPRTNMGSPINSSRDDCSFVVMDSGNYGYLSSNRNGGAGSDDLFYWEINLPIEKDMTPESPEGIMAHIEIRNQENERFDNAQITMIRLKSPVEDAPTLSEPFFITNVLDSTLIDALGSQVKARRTETGDFKFPVQPKDTYMVIADHKNYITSQQVIEGKLLLESPSYAIQLNPTDKSYLALKKTTPRVDPVTGPVATSITLNDQVILTAEDKINQEIKEPVVMIAAVLPTSDEEFTSKGGVILETDEAVVESPSYIPVFSSLLYGFNKYILNKDSKKQLTDVVSLLRREISTEVIVESHTDTRGDVQYNQELSQKRANQVKAYLIEQGIPSSRIKAIGYGASRPLIDCPTPASCTEEQHQKNRRTEFIMNRKE